MYQLPELNYDYDGLGKYISKDIMLLHHTKHHQGYVDKLNAALDGYQEGKDMKLLDLLTSVNDLPQNVASTIRNNGGGHYNHSLFWQCMNPNGGGEPSGDLMAKISEKYGSYQAFVDEFSAKALSVFGSGWVWLQPDMDIVTTPNQDSPIMTGGPEPILGLDVWEHAYYLDYQNRRPDYVAAWWNVVDWQFVADRLSSN